MQFQPSEIAKGTLVLATAQILSAMQTEKGADKHAFKYILWTSVPILLLIVRENFSTAVLLGAVIIMMMIIGRVPMKLIGILDRKSTRLNSSHANISYAVFCLTKKTTTVVCLSR